MSDSSRTTSPPPGSSKAPHPSRSPSQPNSTTIESAESTSTQPASTSAKRKRSASPAVVADKPTKSSNSQTPTTPSSDPSSGSTTPQPPLPNEPLPPPLPNEPLPGPTPEDDGWAPVWDAVAQAYYFYNRFTHATQWENPRVPEPPATAASATNHDRIHHTRAPLLAASTATATQIHPAVAGGYNPAIHGDYDPTADYALLADPLDPSRPIPGDDSTGTAAGGGGGEAEYAASANFNRFTGRFQSGELRPENFNDENKSKRQMNAFFDVDAAANSHDGRSLRAERAGKKLSKSEVKAFRERKREKKEERRRAWLRD